MLSMEIIKLIYSFIVNICRYLKKYDKDIIYININKKHLGEDKRSIEREIGIRNKHIVKVSSSNTKYAKLHLTRMKYVWKRIEWSEKYSKKIYYTGCVSVPFAVYDGFRASDKCDVIFAENDKSTNEKYLIEFKKNLISNVDNIIIEEHYEEVNVIINNSFEINENKIPKRETFTIDMKLDDEHISNENLNVIYQKCLSLFDQLDYLNVKKIHLYIAAKQAVAFTVGKAIQNRHPKIYCYEYIGGSYKWCISIQEGKIIK